MFLWHDRPANFVGEAEIMMKKISAFMAVALPILVFAVAPRAATAQSYTGNWPASVTQSRGSNGSYCMNLTDNGSVGWPHSGQAQLSGAPLGRNTLFGTFQLIDGLLIATFESEGGSGQNAGLVFIGHASGGSMTRGVYDDVYGGEEIDSGVIAFGVKGDCSDSRAATAPPRKGPAGPRKQS
jgi:hypothetical protein